MVLFFGWLPCLAKEVGIWLFILNSSGIVDCKNVEKTVTFSMKHDEASRKAFFVKVFKDQFKTGIIRGSTRGLVDLLTIQFLHIQ